MFGLISLIGIAQGEPTKQNTAGLFWNETATESSLGFQRYHHGVGGWIQHCQPATNETWTAQQTANSCWQITARTGFDAGQIPSTETDWLSNHMLTNITTLDVSKGVHLGTRSTTVGFFTGAGLDVYMGGIEHLAISVRPSIITEIQIQIPIQENAICLSGGNRIGLHRSNPMMAIGWGTQW